MNFWEVVDDELKYLGKSRKELAAEADFDPSYIPKGIARNGIPAADLAVRIARALGVTAEYLVGASESSAAEKNSTASRETHLYRKYAAFIRKLEQMEEAQREALLRLLETLVK
ncbi:MAG: helix-turn-helix transcriptional regulator [Bacteroides sp.]|nr:helix-turn-helix transcriptional regulator [Prevotella sp.]MCM1408248.1 helix-turn-helix transcriptional regulator [Treponema brennaborense]MCM1469572.1 helix-turn-helix transcriptional regulator [Bacteroides sp.]